MSSGSSETSEKGAQRGAEADGQIVDLSSQATPLYGGRYELQELLGVGASGSVYRARDVELGELVALKVLRKELLGDAATVENFRNEVRLARRVTHPNVARVFDIGEHDGEKFLTMELLSGQSLSQRLVDTVDGKPRPLPLREIATLLDQLCAALTAAHRSGIIHCDLKPDNILLCSDGRVVVTDFGIARALFHRRKASKEEKPRQVVGRFDGTPMYVSPEQVNGEDVDARTDLYSLGVVLYELVTGVTPFAGDSLVALLMARVLAPIPNPRSVRPDVPESIAAIVMRCLRVARNERFQSTEELARAFRAAVDASESDPTVQLDAKQFHSALAAARTTNTSAASMIRDSGEAAREEAFQTVTAKAANQSTAQTVAVFPLINQGSKEDDYFVDGLTQEIIDGLSFLHGIRVFGKGAVSNWSGRESDLLQVGKELGAGLLISGSVRRVGVLLRITVRMVKAVDGIQVYAHRADCLDSDLLVKAESIVTEIAAALKLQEQSQPKRAPKDADLVEKYLRARYLYSRSDHASLEQSVALFEELLHRSPADARLLLHYALTLSRLWFFGGQDGAQKAQAAAEQLVKVAPNHSASFLALAGVLFQGTDLVGTVRALGRALTLNPDLADAHELLGRILVETGPIRDGLMRLTLARTLDPGLFRVLVDQARTCALLGDFDRAHALLADDSLRGRSFAIQWILRGRLCLWARDQKRALQYLADPEIVQGLYPRAKLLFHAAAGHNQIEPQMVLSAGIGSERSSPRGRTFVFQMQAELFATYGQLEQTVRSVARSVDAGLTDLAWLERCPPLQPLSKDPRMTALHRVVYGRALAIRDALSSVPSRS